jgi:N-acetylglutamate synthase-like GNAT family acetyltransferase
MRSIRKAVLEDVGALSDCDREFGFGSRKEFVERAIRRGGGYILEQEGRVIGVAALEYTFFEHGFISLLYVSAAERRTGAGEMLLQYCCRFAKHRSFFPPRTKATVRCKRYSPGLVSYPAA